jgi:5-deoxy-glucuronate isomerase
MLNDLPSRGNDLRSRRLLEMKGQQPIMKSQLHIRPAGAGRDGRVLHVTPKVAGWKYVGFDLYRLQPAQGISQTNVEREICVVIITGTAALHVNGTLLTITENRVSPFDGKPWGLYVPVGSNWEITALTSTEVAVCSAPAKVARKPKLIRPDKVPRQMRGAGSNTRYVYDLLPENEDVADSLLVLEAITPAGSWSSYPPHKHDVDDLPQESSLEEVYYYRIRPSSGFAVQRIYTRDRTIDETISVSDGEAVLVPYGNHPVGAPHGYDLYYLNVMAGPKRVWRIRTDPDHQWILSQAGQ